MKKLSAPSCAVLASCLLAVSVTCPASEASSDSSFFEAAVTCPDTVDVSRDMTLDYAANSFLMDYHFENTGSDDAVCYLEVPVITTLDASHQDLYTAFLTDRSGERTELPCETLFSPLFSISELSGDTVTASLIHEFHDQSAQLPSEDGMLYTIRPEQAGEEGIQVLSISALSEGSCKIYPIGCSYTVSEGVYEITLNKEEDEGYLFVTGEEAKDFSVDLLSDPSCLIDSERSSLDDFIELSCEIFLEETPLDAPVDKEVLMQHLAQYLNSSSVTVSLDLIPSLQWLVKQQLFEVYSYELTVKAGETLTASIVRNSELPVNAVSINPVLTNSGAPLSSNLLHIQYRDDYTGASLRRAKGTYDKETATFTMTDTGNGTYQVVLSKTPVWVKGYQYIIPMFAVMLVFLGLCVLVSLRQKKAGGQPEASKEKTNPEKKE